MAFKARLAEGSLRKGEPTELGAKDRAGRLIDPCTRGCITCCRISSTNGSTMAAVAMKAEWQADGNFSRRTDRVRAIIGTTSED